MLAQMTEAGYRFIFFDEHQTEEHRSENIQYEDHERVAIMRHDVDLSVEYAYRLAQIEYEQRIKSTYFFLLTSPFYNICEPAHIRMIHEMIDMGHHIGLHYDHQAYPEHVDIKASIRHEASLLSSILGTPVRVFSYHRPTIELLTKPVDIDLINAYHMRYMEYFRYISDSNHQWKDGCLMEYIRDRRKLYILTHPIWWIHDYRIEPVDKVIHFRNRLRSIQDVSLSNSIRGYKKYLLTSEWE